MRTPGGWSLTVQQSLINFSVHQRTVTRRSGKVGPHRIVQVAFGDADRDQAAAHRAAPILGATRIEVLYHLPVGLLGQNCARRGRQIGRNGRRQLAADHDRLVVA